MSDITTGTELDGSLGTITRTNGDISAGVAMSGAIAPPQALSGDVTTSLSLTGSLSSQTAPDGSVTTGNEIEGQIVGGPKGDKGDKGDQGDPGVVQTVVAGTDISVDNSDPANPVITNTRTSAVWGNITGTLSTQTDLQTALNAKYNASNPSGYTTNTGTVTSVGVSVPTGLQVSGSPITTSGTAAITYQTGYQGYTTAEASKLSGIADGAEVNVRSDWNAAGGDAEILNKPTIPTKTSDLTNDSSFITSAGAPVQSVNSQTGVVVLDIDDVAPSQSGNSGKVLKTDGTNAAWQIDSGGIASVVAGNNIDVDNTDPLNPVVAVENLTVADITDLTATATELNYTDGVTSNIQTQLDAKANDSDTVHKTGAETIAGAKTFTDDTTKVGKLFQINAPTGNPEFNFQENGTTRSKTYYDITNNRLVFQNNENNNQDAIYFTDHLTSTGNATYAGNVSGFSLSAEVTGYNATVPITGTIDSSVATQPAGLFRNDTNFAHSGNILRAEMKNASDSGNVVYISNAGTGNSLVINDGTTDVFVVDEDGNTATSGYVSVADEAYGAGWNGSTQVPTKNAIYDKIEALGPSVTNDQLQNQELTATYAYVGYENTSDNSWYIYRRTRATNLREYATGLSSYATNWTNRGSLSYA